MTYPFVEFTLKQNKELYFWRTFQHKESLQYRYLQGWQQKG